MNETPQAPGSSLVPEPLPPQQEPWRTVYMGQLAADLVPYHPEPPEAPEDELTQAALADPGDVTLRVGSQDGPPTVWRLLAVLAVAVFALAVVFWQK